MLALTSEQNCTIQWFIECLFYLIGYSSHKVKMKLDGERRVVWMCPGEERPSAVKIAMEMAVIPVCGNNSSYSSILYPAYF